MKPENSTEKTSGESRDDRSDDHVSRERLKEQEKEAIDPTHEKDTDDVRERQKG